MSEQQLDEQTEAWRPEVEGKRLVTEVSSALTEVMLATAEAARGGHGDLEAFAAATFYQDVACDRPGREHNVLWSSFLAGAAWERQRRARRGKP